MEIKPGMLAYITRPNYLENVGIPVTVGKCLGPVERAPGYVLWEVTANGTPMRGIRDGVTVWTTHGYACHPGLIPINDPDMETDDDVSEVLRKPATV